MKAISHAVMERGLSQLMLLEWHRRKVGWMSRWKWVVDARGREAEERWREWIHDVRAEENPFPVRLMWSSEDGATRVLAEMGDSESGALTSVLNEEMPAIPVVVFFCWGEGRSEVLAAVDRRRAGRRTTTRTPLGQPWHSLLRVHP